MTDPSEPRGCDRRQEFVAWLAQNSAVVWWAIDKVFPKKGFRPESPILGYMTRQDVFGDCVAYLIQKSGGYDPTRSSLVTWATHYAQWRVAELRRQSGRAISMVELLDCDSLAASTASGTGCPCEAGEVYDLLDTLRPADRQVIRWYFWGGLTQPEIARRLGVSSKRVSQLYLRGIGKLREIYKVPS